MTLTTTTEDFSFSPEYANECEAILKGKPADSPASRFEFTQYKGERWFEDLARKWLITNQERRMVLRRVRTYLSLRLRLPSRVHSSKLSTGSKKPFEVIDLTLLYTTLLLP